MNKNESSPIQLGEGTSTLRQGFIQEGLSPSLDEKKSHSSSACKMYFVVCTDEMYVQVCVCNRLIGRCVCHIYGQHCRTSHLLQERWHFSFLISSFIPLLFFSQ